MHLKNSDGVVLHDTYIEKLALALVKSTVDASYAFITGAIGLTLIVKGLHPIWIQYFGQQEQRTTNAQENEPTPTRKNRVLKWLRILWNFLRSFAVGSFNNIPLLHCLWCGGIFGLGFWIIIQPTVSQLLKMNQTVIYYVK
jgi:hypothetical protein